MCISEHLYSPPPLGQAGGSSHLGQEGVRTQEAAQALDRLPLFTIYRSVWRKETRRERKDTGQREHSRALCQRAWRATRALAGASMACQDAAVRRSRLALLFPLLLTAAAAEGLRQKAEGSRVFRIEADVLVWTGPTCKPHFAGVKQDFIAAFNAWAAAAAAGVDPALAAGFPSKTVALCDDPPWQAAYGAPLPPYQKRIRMVSRTPPVPMETALKLVESMRADRMAGFFAEAAKSAALTSDWKPQFLRYRSIPTIEIPEKSCATWEPAHMMVLNSGDAAPQGIVAAGADGGTEPAPGDVMPSIVFSGSYMVQLGTYVNSTASCKSFKDVKAIFEAAYGEWITETARPQDSTTPASGWTVKNVATCSNPPPAATRRKQGGGGGASGGVLVKRVQLQGTSYPMFFDKTRKVMAALEGDLEGFAAKLRSKLAQNQELLDAWAPQPLRYRSQHVVSIQGYACTMWDPSSQLLIGGCQSDIECGEMGCSLCEENVCSKPMQGAPCPLDTTRTCTPNGTCA